MQEREAAGGAAEDDCSILRKGVRIMKKRMMALLMAGVMLFAMAGCSSSSSDSSTGTEEATEEAEEVEEVTFELESEFEPDSSYDYYTIIEYTVEGFDPMVLMVCRNAAGTEYDIQCTFFGDPQHVVVEVDGDEMEVTLDKTGFMAGDAPDMVQAAIDNDAWAAIN